MKSVLISIQPKWCELIASGNKTIEVRKTKPTIDTPFKCYIYCTLPKKYDTVMPHYRISNEWLHLYHGKITMGDGLDILCADDYESCKTLNGKVFGEFVCDHIIEWTDDMCPPVPLAQTQLSYSEIRQYCGSAETLYLWHISNLKIYDKPKELCKFYKVGAKTLEKLIDEDSLCEYCADTEYGQLRCNGTPNGPVMCEGRFCDSAYSTYLEEQAITSPPQSWRYVIERTANNNDSSLL